jgi:hypothetical protein
MHPQWNFPMVYCEDKTLLNRFLLTIEYLLAFLEVSIDLSMKFKYLVMQKIVDR